MQQSITLYLGGASVEQWIERWPAKLGLRVRLPLEAKSFQSTMIEVLLHTFSKYHPCIDSV